MAIWFEALYLEATERAKARRLPGISRTQFWVLIMKQVGVSPSERVIKAMLNLGPELEQMVALARVLA